MIRHFKEINKEHLLIAGGKGCNLGEMYNKQFNVPNGFVVTTKAYFDFIEKSNLKGKIMKMLHGLDMEDTARLDKVSADIRKAILSCKLPEELKKEIENALKKFKANKFAVRSSSTAEDLKEASFAGQQDTYLNVSKNKIVENVHKCFASLFTSRAVYYRETNKFPHDVGIAVVVQEMVDADFAGVMFTLDPVFKKSILIEIASGLGEKIVSGQITPNNYFLEPTTFEIVEKYEKEDINLELIRKIADIGVKIEKHYNSKQDIEFAVKNGEIFILQARPITTL